MLSTHRLLDVFPPQNFLQLLPFPLQVGTLGPGSSGRTLALHGIGSFAKGKVPHRDTAFGVNYKKLHPGAAVKSRRWKERQNLSPVGCVSAELRVWRFSGSPARSGWGWKRCRSGHPRSAVGDSRTRCPLGCPVTDTTPDVFTRPCGTKPWMLMQGREVI